MSKKIILIFILGLFLNGISLFAQTYPTGAIIDADLYDSVPRKAVLLTRSYDDTPAVYSIKQFAPVPNRQRWGSCTAWASAYAARTIAESIALNRTDRFLTTQNVFSPKFVYKNVRLINYNDPNPSGEFGIAIAHALEFMKREGAVKMPSFEMTTTLVQLMIASYAGYQRYPIADYATLYASWRKLTEDGDPIRTMMVKKCISEGKPVVIAIKCPASFFSVGKDGVWYPTEDPASIDIYKNNSAHALCVVGYDDNKYGGAFEIQNSWGTDWANGGYVWIPYTVFDQFAYEAYEMIEDLSNYETVEFSGFVEIELYNSSQGMPVRFTNGHYQTVGSYPSGTEFRYLIGNNKPAYMYAFAGDSSGGETTILFPFEGVSPVLDYSENVVAFPGESAWIQLDERIGTDYLVVLFSKESLDIDGIRRRFENASGSFPARVARAAGSHYIPVERASYESGEIRFSAKSTNPNAIFGLLLAIDHRAR